MFRGHGFYHSHVRVQHNPGVQNAPRKASLLRRRRQKFIPELYPGLFLGSGVAIAGMAASALGRFV